MRLQDGVSERQRRRAEAKRTGNERREGALTFPKGYIFDRARIYSFVVCRGGRVNKRVCRLLNRAQS